MSRISTKVSSTISHTHEPAKTNGVSEDTSVPPTQTVCIVKSVGGLPEVDASYPVRQASELKPGECLVHITHSGVCHSDLHAKNGDWPVPPMMPLVGGHEGVGIIVAIGANTHDSPVQVGDRVGIKWIADACLQCELCRKGFEQSGCTASQLTSDLILPCRLPLRQVQWIFR